MRSYLRWFFLSFTGGLVLTASSQAASIPFKPDMPIAHLWADRANARYTDKILVITCRTFAKKPAATIGINWTDDCLVVSTAHKARWCGEVFLKAPIAQDPARSVTNIAPATCLSVERAFAAMPPQEVYRPRVDKAARFTASAYTPGQRARAFCDVLPALLASPKGHTFEAAGCRFVRHDKAAQADLFRVWFWDVTDRGRKLYTVCTWDDALAETAAEHVLRVGEIGKTLC